MIEKLKTEVLRKTAALLLALTTVLGPAAMPAFADHSSGDGNADPAPSGDFSGERFLRSLFRNLSGCKQSRWGAYIQSGTQHSHGERLEQRF
jgi:hypothetical protein